MKREPEQTQRPDQQKKSDKEQEQIGERSQEQAQTTNNAHQQHDASYKFLLSSKKLFVELLRFFVDRSWAKEIKEDEVEQIPHSFVLQDFKQQEADIVYRVRIKGRDILFYVLVELQSTVDYRMPYRLLLYQVEIWRYWLENTDNSQKNRKRFSLPPIVPIVLYNGKGKWTAKRVFRQLLQNEKMFGSELLNYEYILIDVARYSEEHLLSLVSALSAVFLVDQTEDQEQLKERLHKLVKIFQQLPEEDQQKFMTWMSYMLRRKLSGDEESIQQLFKTTKGEEFIMGLEKVLADIKHSGVEEGIQIGEEKGIRIGEEKGIRIGEERARITVQQEKENIAKQLLMKQVDIAIIEEATGLSRDTIEQLRK